MAPRVTRLFSFPLDDSLRKALEAIREESGAPVAYQIRRGIAMWLEANGKPVAGVRKKTGTKKTSKRGQK